MYIVLSGNLKYFAEFQLIIWKLFKEQVLVSFALILGHIGKIIEIKLHFRDGKTSLLEESGNHRMVI